jgi:hypothetical protein
MVRFTGAWPEGIVEVRVAVFETYPVESFLDLSGYSDSIPVFSDSSAYEVRLSPGAYGVVTVVCRKSASWDASCLLGFYHEAGDPETPKSVNVSSGTFTGGIDISVDFGNRGAVLQACKPLIRDLKSLSESK